MTEFQEFSDYKEEQQNLVLDVVLNSLIEKGKLQESLKYIAQSITVRINQFGEFAQEVLCYARFFFSKIFRKTILQFQETQPYKTISIFNKIEQIIHEKFAQDNTKLNHIRVDLFNHLACCYQKLGKFKEAQKYLKKALANSNQQIGMAQTYINLSSIQSQMNQHQKALESGFQSMHIIQDLLMQEDIERSFNSVKKSEATYQSEHENLNSILAIAYHNIGVEFENLQNHELSLIYYKKAVNTINKKVPNLPVASKILHALKTAQVAIKSRKKLKKQQSSRSRPQSAQHQQRFPRDQFMYSKTQFEVQNRFTQSFQNQRTKLKSSNLQKMKYSDNENSYNQQSSIQNQSFNTSFVKTPSQITNTEDELKYLQDLGILD